MRRETILDTLKMSLSMVSNMIRLVVLWLACGHVLLGGNLCAQDYASLLDVAAANGECLQNYDVSYRISTFADFPKDKDKRDAVISAYRNQVSRVKRRVKYWGGFLLIKNLETIQQGYCLSKRHGLSKKERKRKLSNS